jgi:hypothetical protein
VTGIFSSINLHIEEKEEAFRNGICNTEHVAFVQAISNMIQIKNIIIPLISEPLCRRVRNIASCKDHKDFYVMMP